VTLANHCAIRAIYEDREFGPWHESEVAALPAYVGYRWKTGQHMLNASFSHFDRADFNTDAR
jgi:hypothetical protein